MTFDSKRSALPPWATLPTPPRPVAALDVHPPSDGLPTSNGGGRRVAHLPRFAPAVDTPFPAAAA